MNCFLSIRAYQLIEDLQESRQYKLTSLAEEFLSGANNSSFVNQKCLSFGIIVYFRQFFKTIISIFLKRTF